MPYILEEARIALEREDRHEITAGELNYSITKLCLRYLNEHGEKYQIYNDIVGALACAQQELYRRKIAPYEQKAIERNGDVF